MEFLSTVVAVLMTMKICTAILEHEAGWQAWMYCAFVVYLAAKYLASEWQEQ